ncbi:MAG: HAMP domain-containing histidine kinase [Xanthomonadales bacterium]|nr:Sensor histidine kinase RcsC [Xanthomonadales bacterium]MCC6592863.1 HAMP domain-containing histidine kinase [Xanthomonadales bacterium]MCE7931173.1 sensor histidine kinase [Xanthomonadales bacterium PRO6]
MRTLTPVRLRLLLLALLLALALPSAVLLRQTVLQLRYESLHQYRTLAEEIATRIDLELQRLIAIEEARSVGDYQFLTVAAAGAKLVQRSPLAELQAAGAWPGLVGHFVIDGEGRFATPLWPQTIEGVDLGIDAGELERRRAVRDRMAAILGNNRLWQPPARANEDRKVALAKNEQADADAGFASQAGFDRLNSVDSGAPEQQSQLGRVDELRLDRAYVESARKDQARPEREVAQAPANALARGKRRERGAAIDAAGELSAANLADARVRLFESEVDPFEFAWLADGHGVLFRRVWRDGGRTIQGLLFEQNAFIGTALADAFRGSALWSMSDLTVAWRESILQLIRGGSGGTRGYSRASELRGELLYQTRLSPPLDGLQLIWSARRLPAGAGARVVWWSGALLFVVLLGGFWLLYRLGLKQIRLARQQQDFVAAVSHELKTPLTSIRMYAEMLREGWAGEDRKRSYYDYIHDESERLSRLIANVLQLARMERNEHPLELKRLRVDALCDLLRSKVDSQIARAGFEVEYHLEAGCAARELRVDADALCQIVINLVDNAIKFSAAAPVRRIEIGARAQGEWLLLGVRDHGFGIPKPQLKRIFGLFYRGGDELTRETVGTGIGLALVRQLARAMGGEVDAQNREPGAEFQLRLPFATRSAGPSPPTDR